MKIRMDPPLPGIYQDLRAAVAPAMSRATVAAARSAGASVVFESQGEEQIRDGILFLEKPADLPPAPAAEEISAREKKRLKPAFKQFPEEVFALAGAAAVGPHPELRFRTFSTHFLARELSASAIAAAWRAGRYYSAADWLCDPAGFFFIAENILGVYDLGDRVPLTPGTQLRVNLPIRAKISIEHDGATVAETDARQFLYAIRQTGDYTLRVSLTIDGETWRWIDTGPIHVEKSPPLALPAGQISPEVEVRKSIPYLDDGLDKHKLDLYLPRGKDKFPVMVFLHGGAWRGGDRSLYPLLGNRFALAGIGVAIPSYRLMPKYAYPAQPDDAAAAFAWVHRYIGELGGDVSRIYLAGHSAGGHLASLVALDPKYLAKYGLDPSVIRGVISLSGVYRVGGLADFQNADDDPSPMDHVHKGAPPFLLTYCQWDYFDLPRQARDFDAALEEKFVPARMIYIAGESHASEIIDTVKPDDATARAILDFIR